MDDKTFKSRFNANERIIFFSDAVIAIVLTLLVIELNPPHVSNPQSASELFNELSHMYNRFGSFVLSFFFIVNLWFNLNQFFKLLIKIDDTLVWINNLLLLCICFIPFQTALISEYPDNSTAMILFGVDWIVVPLLFYAMGTRALKHNLVSPVVDLKRFHSIRKIIRWYFIVGLVPIAMALYWPQLAFLFYIVLLLGGILLGFRVKLND